MAFIIDDVLLDLIEFDALINEKWGDSAEWTEFPVESGIPITDNVTQLPTTVDLTGVFTSSPLGPGAVAFPDRAAQAYERLLALKERGALVTVVTGLRVFSSMGITTLDTDRDPDTGLQVIPVLSLLQVRIVNSVEVPIPPQILESLVKADQQSSVDAGKQSGAAPDATTSAANSASIGKKIVGSLEGADVGSVLLSPGG